VVYDSILTEEPTQLNIIHDPYTPTRNDNTLDNCLGNNEALKIITNWENELASDPRPTVTTTNIRLNRNRRRKLKHETFEVIDNYINN
jgi:hypothetical protein